MKSSVLIFLYAMYIPNHFKETDWSKVEPIIQANSFATLISVNEGEPIASHIPLELHIENGDKFLCGHISKANPLSKILDEKKNLLIIF
jgi:transcriptional regulator